jgi:hypothetical protein
MMIDGRSASATGGICFRLANFNPQKKPTFLVTLAGFCLSSG